ncbi:MAG: bifunctional metallophosphatase/5'-nucleotidase [Lachnospiraceae bacterium]|nr:bifunctional metallophosphatase/5'-nucleotidase [Lachnospiraceae bacterium]
MAGRMIRKAFAAALASASLMLTGCSAAGNEQFMQALEYVAEYAADAKAADAGASGTEAAVTGAGEASAEHAGDGNTGASETADTETADTEAAPEEEPSDLYILFSSDVHCGIDQGFGLAGLWQVRETLEKNGYETLLVDNGDAFQGEAIGTVTDGEAIVPLMNELKYDAAIPGNHDFDYGMDEFNKLIGMADFPYISCNFTKEGKLVFPPYLIKEAGGRRIAFVGVTTPETLADESPELFRDDEGNYIYGFMQGDGSELYGAVQKAVDAARAEDPDYVYLLAHVGNNEESKPYSIMDIAANTEGIDVILDGHSHDSDHMVLKDRNGNDVERYACGTKMDAIGYSHIKPDGTVDTGIWVYNGADSLPYLLGIENDVSRLIGEENAAFEEKLGQVVAKSEENLTITDPEKVDDAGLPVRIVRNRETNLADLCADAVRIRTGADIGIVNGGGVRANIAMGDVTFGDIIAVHPFGNRTVVIKATGQQILDALEWSCHMLPDENGGFLQVSGMTFSVDTSVESTCTADENVQMTGIGKNRRVSDVKVGGVPIDPAGKYTVAGNSYILIENGNGYTSFDGAELIAENAGLDNQLLIDYIDDSLKGVIGDDYADPYGQGRITIR